MVPLTEILAAFAQSIDNDDDDLETTFEDFCEANDISEDDTDILKNILVEASRQVGGEGTDNDIKSLLKHLAQPFPKAETRYPNQVGMTPEAGETSTKGFLKKLPVAAPPDPYGNKGFSADHYKAYDRQAHRHGYNYSHASDFNNEKPSWPLANPELNVNQGATDQNESHAFEAVDAVGLGALVHWRVVNKSTGEYVTKQIHREDAQEIAADLNQEFVQQLREHWYHHSTIGNYHILQGAGVHGGEWAAHEQGGYSTGKPKFKKFKKKEHAEEHAHLSQHGGLGENNLSESVSRKHFQATANSVRAIEDPVKRQEFANHHAALFAAQNPRFDHARFHAACGTVHGGGKVQKNEAKQIAPIHENLMRPLNPKYLEAMQSRNNFTMSGDVAQSYKPQTQQPNSTRRSS